MIFETKQVIDTPTLPYEGTINILCQKAVGGTGSTGHILADDFLAGIEGSIALTGQVSGPLSSTIIEPGVVTNAMIHTSAAIADSKLATITTANKVSNSATTATSANVNDAIACRDGSGNCAFGTISGALSGNATSATTALTATDFTGILAGNIVGTQGATVIDAGVIVNSMINAGAGIVDTKLATIETANKVSNSATTGTSLNSPNTLMLRDVDGNVSAGIITGALNGNANTATSAITATSATTAVNFSGSLVGNITGTQGATVIGAGVITNSMISGSAAIADSKLDTIATALKVSNSATTATSANTPDAIVARDGSGNATMGQLTLATGLMLPTTGGTATLLDFCETGTFSITLTGPASTGARTASFVRVGKQVSVYIPGGNVASGASAPFTGSAVIPSRLRPKTGFNYDDLLFVTNNGVLQSDPGRIVIEDSGNVTIYRSFVTASQNFSATSTAGYLSKWATYETN